MKFSQWSLDSNRWGFKECHEKITRINNRTIIIIVIIIHEPKIKCKATVPNDFIVFFYYPVVIHWPWAGIALKYSFVVKLSFIYLLKSIHTPPEHDKVDAIVFLINSHCQVASISQNYEIRILSSIFIIKSLKESF